MCVARRAAPLARIDGLEARRLFAAPAAAIAYAAQASDRYVITTSPSAGGNIPANTPLTAVAASFNETITFSAGVIGKTTFGTFDIELPSGPTSTQFLEWVTNGRLMPSARIDALTSTGLVRESWTLGAAAVSHFKQVFEDGFAKDEVSFSYTSIAVVYHRYAADGTETLPALSMSWNLNTASGSTTSVPYATDYVATTPAAKEAVEFGSGQIPTADSVFEFSLPYSGGGGGSSKPSAEAITYSAVDGPDSITTLGNLVTARVANTVIYTKRDPTTGLASQRYRLGQTYVTKYAFSDSTLDNLPRQADYGLTALQYQLQNYAYNSTQTPAATASGFDFQRIVSFNPGFNAANVVGPSSGSVNAPVSSVTFKFLSPIALTTSMLSVEGLNLALLTLSSPDSGLTWVVGNLAAAQTSDGNYVVKILADKVNTLSTSSTGGPLFTGSAGRSWKLDRSGPSVTASAFSYNDPAPTPYAFSFTLSERATATATDSTAPILIRRVDTGALVATAMGHLGSDGVTLSGSLAAVLADGRHTATLPAGSVRDDAGNILAVDTVLPFFVLAGDANHDAIVNFADLVILAQNYNKAGMSFAQGNFNRSPDGKVDFADLVILAQNYNKSLPALVAPATNASSAKPSLKTKPAITMLVI